jgi:hypothetical protein
MDEKDQERRDRFAQETRADFMVLRTLTEAIINTLTEEHRADVITAFREGCESLIVSALHDARRDETVTRFEQAVARQMSRLVPRTPGSPGG